MTAEPSQCEMEKTTPHQRPVELRCATDTDNAFISENLIASINNHLFTHYVGLKLQL